MSQKGYRVLGEKKAYLLNQGELGERSIWSPGTTLDWTAVKLLRALHVLSDRGIDHTILRVVMPGEGQRERKKQRDICIIDCMSHSYI